MDLLSDIITYVRRIIKIPSGSQITDALIIDYINRFWIMDMDARVQLFDLKTTYQFQTIPGITSYNMPLYNVQNETGDPSISYYPVYQGFLMPASINGIQVPFYTDYNAFWNLYPNYIQYLNPAATGDGTAGPYTINLAEAPAVPGYLDMSGIIAAGNDPVADPIFSNTVPNTAGVPYIPFSSMYPGIHFTATDESGNNMSVQDTGIFLSGNTSSQLYGLLVTQNSGSQGYESPHPYNYDVYATYSTTLNTVNYTEGVAYVTFPNAVPAGSPINAAGHFFQQGMPRGVLYYNNCLQISPPPDISYNVQLTAYLSPSAFLSSGQAIQFGYMAEYIARGAARKILSDTGDTEQFMFYEPLFREQEMLVWKRSQRQFTSTRTGTIFSDGQGQNTGYNQIGGGN